MGLLSGEALLLLYEGRPTPHAARWSGPLTIGAATWALHRWVGKPTGAVCNGGGSPLHILLSCGRPAREEASGSCNACGGWVGVLE